MEKKLNLHVNMDDFIPATAEEKAYMVQMRPSSTFFKDGLKRLLKNKVATVSFVLVILIALPSIILPMFWPYAYDAQLGITPGKPVDASYNNLAPFQYGATELKRMEAGEKIFPTSSVPTQQVVTTSSAWSSAPVSLLLSASSQVSSC